MKVHFFDVGEGDSTFFELPDGKTMLIDAGKTNEGPAVVQDIKGLGYKKIDYLITSHPDADHIGGVPAVLGAFSISEVWAPRVTHTTTTYESFLDAVKDKGLSIRTAQAGKQIGSAAQYSVDILSPVAGATYRNLNDWSVIIKVTHKKNTLLFVGDASSDVILAAGSGRVDLYKVGHHGSKTSTNAAVIESLASEYNVISVGKNSYGHPTDLVLKLLSKYQVYRTDHSGTVIAYSDGNNITFSTKSSAHQAPASEANKTSQRVYAR
jgi:beta-lactamase superfamily II metal-dependent hydrolase